MLITAPSVPPSVGWRVRTAVTASSWSKLCRPRVPNRMPAPIAVIATSAIVPACSRASARHRGDASAASSSGSPLRRSSAIWLVPRA